MKYWELIENLPTDSTDSICQTYWFSPNGPNRGSVPSIISIFETTAAGFAPAPSRTNKLVLRRCRKTIRKEKRKRRRRSR